MCNCRRPFDEEAAADAQHRRFVYNHNLQHHHALENVEDPQRDTTLECIGRALDGQPSISQAMALWLGGFETPLWGECFDCINIAFNRVLTDPDVATQLRKFPRQLRMFSNPNGFTAIVCSIHAGLHNRRWALGEIEGSHRLCAKCLVAGRSGNVDDCGCVQCHVCGRGFEAERPYSTDRCEEASGSAICITCCGCSNCEGCGESSHSVEINCDNCGRCRDCCECYTCEDCGDSRHSDDICHDCNRCTSGCCHCQECAIETRSFGGPHFMGETSKPRGSKVADVLYRHLGAEIEISAADSCGTKLTRLLSEYQVNVVTDGSLPDSGNELVTQPMAGKTWVTALTELGAALKANGAEVNEQCGLHIHVDARDLTVWDIRRFARVYEKLEPLLFAVVAPSRRDSHYCQPCGNQLVNMTHGSGNKLAKQFKFDHYKVRENDYRQEWSDKLGKYVNVSQKRLDARMAKAVQEIASHKYNDTRYRAVNMHSWFHRGTIEFRHSHGTVNAENIIRWGHVVGSLVDWAANTPDSKLDSYLDLGDKALLERILLERTHGHAAFAWWKVRYEHFIDVHTNGRRMIP